MKQQYTEYVTNEGDRLDLISRDQTGSFYSYPAIALGNPATLKKGVLPSGLLLRLSIAEVARLVDREVLPPWKR